MEGRWLVRIIRRTQLRWILWIVVFFCALLLSGCGEVLNEYYLSNHTDTVLTVRFTPLYIETVKLWSGPLIEDIQKSARSSLTQPVSFEQEGETLQFIVPAKTTVFLGISGGGNDLFSQLNVNSNNLQLAMDRDDYKQYFAVHDNFVGAVVHVLNVK